MSFKTSHIIFFIIVGTKALSNAVTVSSFHKELYNSGDVSGQNLGGSEVKTMITCASLCGANSVTCQGFKYNKASRQCHLVQLNPGAVASSSGTEAIYVKDVEASTPGTTSTTTTSTTTSTDTSTTTTSTTITSTTTSTDTSTTTSTTTTSTSTIISTEAASDGIVTCTTSPSGWDTNSANGKSYFYKAIDKNFMDAKGECEGASLSMAQFRTQAEFNAVLHLISAGGDKAFIGMHDPNQSGCHGISPCGPVLRWYQNGDSSDEPVGTTVTGFMDDFGIGSGKQFVKMDGTRKIESTDSGDKSNVVCMCKQP